MVYDPLGIGDQGKARMPESSRQSWHRHATTSARAFMANEGGYLLRIRILLAVTAAAVLVGATAGPALAHECFNTSRSERGNAGASHSQRWLTLSFADFFAEEGLTPGQVEDAMELWEEMGNPSTATIFIGNHTIAGGTPSMELLGHASNGKGIDHLEAAFIDDFITVLCTVVPAACV
jgi:hypothetical protein